MCTRSLQPLPTTEEPKSPHIHTPPSSTTSIDKPSEKNIGPYGAYNDPLLPPSDEMRAIVGDMISMAGGVAAVLLQIAHPAVGAGVAAHSSFTIRPIERGRRSIIYMYVQAFGTPEERRYITDATHKSHANINGFNAGTAYDANDVDLQLWVAATTYWSLITSYEMAYGRLLPHVRQRVYKEFSSMATALHVPAEKWPVDEKAFDVYWEGMLKELRVTNEAKEVGKLVLYPAKGLFKFKTLHAWLYMVINGPLSRVVTSEMLPEEVRNAFSIPSTKRTRGVYKFAVAVTKVVWPPLPRWTKHSMKNFYMWDMRKRREKGKRW